MLGSHSRRQTLPGTRSRLRGQHLAAAPRRHPRTWAAAGAAARADALQGNTDSEKVRKGEAHQWAGRSERPGAGRTGKCPALGLPHRRGRSKRHAGGARPVGNGMGATSKVGLQDQRAWCSREVRKRGACTSERGGQARRPPGVGVPLRGRHGQGRPPMWQPHDTRDRGVTRKIGVLEGKERKGKCAGRQSGGTAGGKWAAARGRPNAGRHQAIQSTASRLMT